MFEKKKRFIKDQEASRLSSSLGIKTGLDEIPKFGPILFLKNEMNEIINKFLLVAYKFKPEIHLRQTEFTYSDCRT